MIGKHVDLIALTFLLLMIAAFSGAKQVVLLTLSGPVHYIRMEDSREVRMPEPPQMPALPDMPRLPHVPLQRD